jgi:RNA polymerase sigma-70 factor (ECF subfamily)
LNDFPETESVLLAQIKSLEDQQAWEQFVSIYRPVIMRLASKRGMQKADAEDLTQQVLLSVAKSIDRWKKQNESVRFRHWLHRVAKNAIINAMKRKPRDLAVGGSTVGNRLSEQPSGKDPIEEVELEYRRELFLQAASIVQGEVEPETWQAFQRSVIEGMPIEKVASDLCKSIGKIYAARSRVMRKLKKAIERLELS